MYATAIAAALATYAAAAVAAPLIPVAVPTSSSNVNSGAFDNGSVANVGPFGSNTNSWNSGFNAHQNAAANPWGNAGSSSFNNWNNNAWSNMYPYPMPYW
ncbi:hypothetical protein IWQ57_000121 [Coemansia nantahalensis]|uniref:Uncharacterized protein n=1 Tax=Coemansia nantahalensis TaxID=2789366 RepID=A0ACC1K9F4_9FUNG|nr:hypothetical protein IWQ57_000121 [Coemansia nantahalensis]